MNLKPESILKDRVLQKLKEVFESYGFFPVESPAIELWQVLARKAGEEIEKQVYRFKDKSGRDLALRFDLTVPLARIVASRLDLPLPFKRYQIGPVWRYEEVRAGKRYREFWQADCDIVGVSTLEADAEVLALGCDGLEKLGIKDFYIKLNSRQVLERLLKKLGIPEKLFLPVCRVIDKLDKFPESTVLNELKELGLKQPEKLLKLDEGLLEKLKVKAGELEEIRKLAEEWGFEKRIRIDLNLARGLDYYTGLIFEFKITGKEEVGTVVAGGRYDGLIGLFAKKSLPATGISFGIDRLLSVLKHQQKTLTQVFVCLVKPELRSKAVEICQKFRRAGIPCELDLKFRPLSKQLEYADKLGIPWTLFLGPEEIKKGRYKLRNMETGEELQLDFDTCLKVIKTQKQI